MIKQEDSGDQDMAPKLPLTKRKRGAKNQVRQGTADKAPRSGKVKMTSKTKTKQLTK